MLNELLAFFGVATLVFVSGLLAITLFRGSERVPGDTD